MRKRYHLMLLALIISMAGQPVLAQQRMIPEELALALLGARGSLSSTIVVGQLPAGFPNGLNLPAGSRIVGGITMGRYSTTAIVSVPGNTSTARTAMEQVLVAAGFTQRRQEVRSQPFQQGGFTQNPTSFLPNVFCRADAALSLSTWSLTNDPTHLRLDYTPTVGNRLSACDARAQPDPTREAPLPTLTVPEGARSGGSGGGGGSDHREAYTQLETPATALELVDHFSAQFRTAGWTPVSRTNAAGISVATFRLQKDGREWLGVLTSVEFSGTAWHEVNMRVIAARE